MKTFFATSCVVSLLVVLVTSAPINTDDAVVETSPEQIADQVKDLEQLAQSQMGDNVHVKETKTTSFSDIDGNVEEVTDAEKTVLNGDTGDIISDVKQETTETQQEGEAPQTIVKTELDLPLAGIHREIVEGGEDAGQQEIDDDPINFSPDAVAEYLYQTHEYEEFQKALEDIVASGIMSVEEGQDYYNAVVLEYNAIEEENAMKVEQELGFQFPSPWGLNKRTQASTYPENEYIIQQLFGGEPEPSDDDVIRELLAEWFLDAMENGDIESASHIQDLRDYMTLPRQEPSDNDMKQLIAELFTLSENNPVISEAMPVQQEPEETVEKSMENDESSDVEELKQVESQQNAEEQSENNQQTKSDEESESQPIEETSS